MIERLGRYRILRPLGEGGMGRLYLGEAEGASGFSRRVVVKLVKHELDPGLTRALLDEARLVSSLVHRNIVPVLDLDEASGERLVILEHVDGMDLRQLLEKRERLTWPLAVFIGSEVAAGLDYAHRKSDPAGRPLAIVHRDVSPANILLSWEGEVKLTDFGVAKFARSDDGSLGGLKGNLGYMAPEQARGEPVDARADLFALGVVLYEALTGKNPFRARTDLLTLARLREGEVPRLPASHPPALAEAIARATAPDPRARFSTAAALRAALLAVPGQPADPARQLAGFVCAARAARPLDADALVDAVLGPGRQTAVKPADTVEDPHLPEAVRRARGPRHLSRAKIAALVFGASALVVLGMGVLRHREANGISPRPPATPAAFPIARPPAPTATASATPTPTAHAPEHARPRPRRGTLSVNAIPWATIFLDGHNLGHTPRQNLTVEAGRHHLRLVTSGGDVRAQTIEVSPSKALRVTVDFARP
ncbi:MAG TPA: protein kinase [Polyangia bacterium]